MRAPFELTYEEGELLMEILVDRLGTLREQVYHTDTWSFRDELRTKQRCLKDVLRKLERSIGETKPQLQTG